MTAQEIKEIIHREKKSLKKYNSKKGELHFDLFGATFENKAFIYSYYVRRIDSAKYFINEWSKRLLTL